MSDKNNFLLNDFMTIHYTIWPKIIRVIIYCSPIIMTFFILNIFLRRLKKEKLSSRRMESWYPPGLWAGILISAMFVVICNTLWSNIYIYWKCKQHAASNKTSMCVFYQCLLYAVIYLKITHQWLTNLTMVILAILVMYARFAMV